MTARSDYGMHIQETALTHYPLLLNSELVPSVPTGNILSQGESGAFSCQVIELWTSCVRLAQLLTHLQHGQAPFLECSVETSRDLRCFNALTNPRFIISLLTPGGDMLFTPEC